MCSRDAQKSVKTICTLILLLLFEEIDGNIFKLGLCFRKSYAMILPVHVSQFQLALCNIIV